MAVRLLVTRPEPQAGAWVADLRAAGFDAEALPLLDIAGPADADAVREAAARLGTFAAVVFVSPNAAQRFFEAARLTQWPAQVLAAGPGPGTAAALRALGVPAACVVEPAAGAPQFDSETLWASLAPLRAWSGTPVLIVRGDGGREFLAQAFGAQGARVQTLQAYRRRAPTWSAAERALLAAALAEPAQHLWLLSSSEAIEHLAGLAPGVSWAAARAVCTHARIATRARVLGFGQVDCIAPGLDPLVQHLKGRLKPSIQSPAP